MATNPETGWFKKHQNSSLIYRQLIVSGLGACLAGGFMFLREVYLARHFGVTTEIGDLLFALAAVQFVNSAFFGALHQVLIREIATFPEERDALYLSLKRLVIGLWLISVPILVAVIALHSRISDRPFSLGTLLWIIAFHIFSACGLIAQAISIGTGRSVSAAFFPAVTPGFLIIWLLFSPISASQIAIGSALAALVELLLFQRNLKFRSSKTSVEKNTSLSQKTAAYLPGTLTIGLAEFVDIGAASFFGGGATALIQYSARLPLMLIGFGSLVMGRVFLPAFSIRLSGEKPDTANFLFKRSFLLLAGAGFTVALLAPWLGSTLTLLFFKQPDIAQTAQIALLQTIYWYSVPFSLLANITLRLLLARGQVHSLSKIFALAFVAKVAGTLLFALQLGIVGIAIGNVCGAFTVLILSFNACRNGCPSSKEILV